MKKSTLFACLYYSFVDYLSFFIVTALFTPLILAQNSLYKDPLGIMKEPEVLLGVILGAYGLGLFLGSPLLGRWSDHYNRKSALQFSMAIYVLGNIGVGYFFSVANVWMIILFRLITGLGSSGAQLLYNVMQDLEPVEKSRGKAMGYLVAVSSFATVIGPAFGSFFAGDKGLELAIPFFVLAFMGGSSLLINKICLPENKSVDKIRKESFFEVFSQTEILVVALCFFLFILNIESIFVAIPIVMVMGFNVTSDWIALFFGYGGLVSVFAGTFVIPWMSRFFSVRLAFLTSLFGTALSVFSFFLVSTPEELFAPFTFFAIFATVAWSKGNELAVAIPDKKNTGVVMGVFGSLIAIAVLLASVSMGYLAAFNSLLPLLTISILAVLNLVVAFLGYQKLVVSKK